jgi:16S rRNA (cytidine1402-2'-O)-methyltransferase
LRALDTLADADILACEDSRVTRKLLTAHGIARRVTLYHEHNAARVRPKLIEAMLQGRSVALVSDAGTPLISDPGYKLAREAAAAGLAVTALPGASAVLAALSVSGLPSDRFHFAGFLPPKSAARRRALAELAEISASLIFFEGPHRLAATLSDMAETLGDRPAALVRELTKRFEETRRATLRGLAEEVAREGPPKGEIVIVVGPPGAAAGAEADLDAHLRAALANDSLRDAVAAVAAASGLPKRKVYARALELGRAEPPPSPERSPEDES